MGPAMLKRVIFVLCTWAHMEELDEVPGLLGGPSARPALPPQEGELCAKPSKGDPAAKENREGTHSRITPLTSSAESRTKRIDDAGLD